MARKRKWIIVVVAYDDAEIQTRVFKERLPFDDECSSRLCCEAVNWRPCSALTTKRRLTPSDRTFEKSCLR
jgi:hypothetical protein